MDTSMSRNNSLQTLGHTVYEMRILFARDSKYVPVYLAYETTKRPIVASMLITRMGLHPRCSLLTH